MEFKRIGDVAIHYRLRRGRAGAPAVVFSNSLGTDFRIWDLLLDEFGDSVTSLCYDKRGHGLSDIGRAPYGIDDHVEDLIGLMVELGIAKATICGLSVGGMIAQGLHAKRPDLVKALILCDTAHKIGTAELWNARIKAVTENGVGAVAGDILQRWFTSGFRREDNPLFVGCRNMLVRAPVEGYAGTCAALRDADFTETTKRIAVPTLCIVGEEDGSTPPVLVRELADLIPGAHLKVIAGAAHIPCIEQPKALAGLIRQFLAPIAKTE